MKDVNCPYCDAEQDINHDDGYGYEEDRIHQQECSDCKKVFTYTTAIIFHYEVEKSQCLNGGEHSWTAPTTYPVRCTRMRCADCGEYREPTKEEWEKILKESGV